MKIYTKSGDKGSTSLFGGTRVDKDSPRLRAYGTIDELNSQIGVVLSNLSSHSRHDRESLGTESSGRMSDPRFREDDELKRVSIIKKLIRIQGELFVLGWDLATLLKLKFKSEKLKVKRIKKSYIDRLEREIDMWTKDLQEIKNFILPGGSKVGAGLHLARTVARRAEREVIALSKEEPINKSAIIYLNRLSDWLFTLARYANQNEKIVETYWKGR